MFIYSKDFASVDMIYQVYIHTGFQWWHWSPSKTSLWHRDEWEVWGFTIWNYYVRLFSLSLSLSGSLLCVFEKKEKVQKRRWLDAAAGSKLATEKIWETCVCLFHKAFISCFISSSTCGSPPAGLMVLILTAEIMPLESLSHTHTHTEWITLGQTSHLYWSWVWSHKAVGICLKKKKNFFPSFMQRDTRSI